MTISRN